MDADEVAKRVKTTIRPKGSLVVTVGAVQKGCFLTAFNPDCFYSCTANSVDEKSKSCVQITLKSLHQVGRGGRGVQAMDAEVTALVGQRV